VVRASYLEIYNEDIRDLLKKDAGNKLELKETPDSGVYVKDLSSYVVRTIITDAGLNLLVRDAPVPAATSVLRRLFANALSLRWRVRGRSRVCPKFTKSFKRATATVQSVLL